MFFLLLDYFPFFLSFAQRGSFAFVFCSGLCYFSQKFHRNLAINYMVKKTILIYCFGPVVQFNKHIKTENGEIDLLIDTPKPLKLLIQLFIAPYNLFYIINVINITFLKFNKNEEKFQFNPS